MLLYEFLNPICFMFFIRNFFIKGDNRERRKLHPQFPTKTPKYWCLVSKLVIDILSVLSNPIQVLSHLCCYILILQVKGDLLLQVTEWLYFTLHHCFFFATFSSNFCHLFPFWSLYCALCLLVTTKAHLTSRLRPLRTKMC